ncbi:MAG: tetratricopeptide repeat protein [Terriglobales bacterium]
MSRKLALLFVLIGLVFAIWRLTGQGPHESNSDSADNAELTFPGQGKEADWKAAVKLCREGKRQSESNNYDKALELDQMGVTRYPYDPKLFASMANIYVKRKAEGDLQQAEVLLHKSVTLAPNDYMYWGRLGSVLAEENKLADAREALTKALQCNPPADENSGLQLNLQLINQEIARQNGS